MFLLIHNELLIIAKQKRVVDRLSPATMPAMRATPPSSVESVPSHALERVVRTLGTAHDTSRGRSTRRAWEDVYPSQTQNKPTIKMNAKEMTNTGLLNMPTDSN